MQPLNFFINNIGKKITRDSDGCNCNDCKEVVEKGLVVRDKDHAQYLFDTQNDFANEGIMLNYRSYPQDN